MGAGAGRRKSGPEVCCDMHHMRYDQVEGFDSTKNRRAKNRMERLESVA